jgi:OOP family OmpA-OmpF porin
MKTIARTLASAALIAAGFAVTSSASAQWYGGVGLGRGRATVPSLSGSIGGAAVTGSTGTSSDNSWKLYGGYQLTPIWGVELGYNNLGNSYSESISSAGATTTSNMKLSNWYGAGTATLPLGRGFSLVGKLGLARNQSEIQNSCVPAGCLQAGTSHRSQIFAGIGAEYAFMPNLAARLEYEDFAKMSRNDPYGTGGGGAIKGNAWTASLKYSF